MANYKSPDNKVHHLDDEAFEYLLPAGSIKITDEEAAELLKPPPETPEQAVERLKSELDAIERAEIMPRKTREIQIQLMEFLAAQQGIPPEQLALNPAYAGMKEVDAQCAALRQQIRDLEP